VTGRIAVLVRQFPKLSETFIFGEIANLIDAGLDVQIISLKRPTESLLQPDANRFSDCVTYLDVKTGIAGMAELAWRLGRSIFRLPSFVRQLRELDATLGQLVALLRICDQQKINHLHAHYISEPALLADLVSQVRAATFSVSAHAKDIYLTRASELQARLNNAAFVTTCTAHNHHFLVQNAAHAAARIHLLYHGIDSTLFHPALRPSKGDRPMIIAIGRYKRKKGFDLLIAACAKLVSDGVLFRCEIVGYGSEKERLQELIVIHDLLDVVTLRGPVTHHELVGILQNAAVCVLPCRETEDGDRDGIPNAMLEAMSCEVPVVSTSVSGIPEVIESGKNGLLVKPNDIPALADAIRQVVSDERLGRRIGGGGRNTVAEMFCWTKNIQALIDMLRDTMVESDARNAS